MLLDQSCPCIFQHHLKGVTSPSIPPTWVGVQELVSNADIFSIPLLNLESSFSSFFPNLLTAATISITYRFDMEPELVLMLVFSLLLGWPFPWVFDQALAFFCFFPETKLVNSFNSPICSFVKVANYFRIYHWSSISVRLIPPFKVIALILAVLLSAIGSPLAKQRATGQAGRRNTTAGL